MEEPDIEDSRNEVVFGRHKITDRKVALKRVSCKNYNQVIVKNKVSEEHALELCRKNKHTINLVERFKVFNDTIIVTDYLAGGNLYHYCVS